MPQTHTANKCEHSPHPHQLTPPFTWRRRVGRHFAHMHPQAIHLHKLAVCLCQRLGRQIRAQCVRVRVCLAGGCLRPRALRGAAPAVRGGVGRRDGGGRGVKRLLRWQGGHLFAVVRDSMCFAGRSAMRACPLTVVAHAGRQQARCTQLEAAGGGAQSSKSQAALPQQEPRLLSLPPGHPHAHEAHAGPPPRPVDRPPAGARQAARSVSPGGRV